MVLSFALQVRPDERVHVGGLSGLPLPPSCASYELFRVRCPGCGLTSFIRLAHGDLAASWRYHRIGWVLALAVVVQIPYRLLALRHAGTRISLARRCAVWLCICCSPCSSATGCSICSFNFVSREELESTAMKLQTLAIVGVGLIGGSVALAAGRAA